MTLELSHFSAAVLFSVFASVVSRVGEVEVPPVSEAGFPAAVFSRAGVRCQRLSRSTNSFLNLATLGATMTWQ